MNNNPERPEWASGAEWDEWTPKVLGVGEPWMIRHGRYGMIAIDSEGRYGSSMSSGTISCLSPKHALNLANAFSEAVGGNWSW